MLCRALPCYWQSRLNLGHEPAGAAPQESDHDPEYGVMEPATMRKVPRLGAWVVRGTARSMQTSLGPAMSAIACHTVITAVELPEVLRITLIRMLDGLLPRGIN